jgi:hypothetical protein
MGEGATWIAEACSYCVGGALGTVTSLLGGGGVGDLLEALVRLINWRCLELQLLTIIRSAGRALCFRIVL